MLGWRPLGVPGNHRARADILLSHSGPHKTPRHTVAPCLEQLNALRTSTSLIYLHMENKNTRIK